MYTAIWNKYLPVLKILLKRALVNEQVLKLDATDFEKVGSSRKATTKFILQTAKGKFLNTMKLPEPAKEFITVLLQEAAIKELLAQNDYMLTLNTKHELKIEVIPVNVTGA